MWKDFLYQAISCTPLRSLFLLMAGLGSMTICRPAQAQTKGLGSWNIVNFKYNLDNRWSAFAEAQLRSLQFYDQFHYYEYKGGFNFKVLPTIKLTFGAGQYVTYQEGGNFLIPKNNDEIRLWPQIILFKFLGRLKIEQRYRSEFRFTSNGYRPRFRFRVGVSYEFGERKKIALSASNEIFLTNQNPYFERNRLLFTLSYKLTPTTAAQIGYLQQFDNRLNDEIGIDFLQVGMYFEWSTRRLNQQKASGSTTILGVD